MTYKVKGNASAPTPHESSQSPDVADKSKENTDGQQYEAYNQDQPYGDEEPEDEAETLRRKNSEEDTELLRAAVQQREKEERLKKQEKEEAERLKK